MFQRLFRLFIPTLNSYTPVRHSFFRDEAIADRLHKEGYCVVDFIDKQQQEALLDLYEKHHQLSVENPGVFFGTFSSNKNYRRIVHYTTNKILESSFDQWFVDYKSAVNTFVVKTPGKSTLVPIHQDGAALDEKKYSSINVWIPLQPINSLNGALSIVPRSHNIFYPFRCNSIPPITKNIERELHPFFKPIYLNLGQAIFFDSRLFHYSEPNMAEQNRVAMLSRICPKRSSIVAYFKEDREGASIEMFECAEEYLVSTVGYEDCERPVQAKLIKTFNANIAPISSGQFAELRSKFGIVEQQSPAKENQEEFNFLKEPKGWLHGG